LVFVIKLGCVFCEVQAEETVDHQASVIIDCKTIARRGENFQCLFKYLMYFLKVFTNLTYREKNTAITPEEHSYHPRRTQLSPQKNTAITPEALCSAEISYHAQTNFALSCWVFFFHVWRKNYAACSTCSQCGLHARSWVVEVSHWESLVMVLCCLMVEMVGWYFHAHRPVPMFLQHGMTVRNFCSFCALLLWTEYRDCRRWEKKFYRALWCSPHTGKRCQVQVSIMNSCTIHRLHFRHTGKTILECDY